ncbi:MAG: hypothetical protein IPG10_14350 [Flavobacteriales bacterium]|jgi:hypothetical protein|nr:hypothetical protein [Flavobacteriales bacterium]MBK6755816.1 hypothetical protein [Flavobacteriales bacterium]MBK7084955.1 hypothetical protein [Flavobacteriales bacterium]MBK7270476.1 hypothetical protein [Flavobacteriales bacterium]MBK7751485.1 hypothetical protein [Flavobacteriales bacterium]
MAKRSTPPKSKAAIKKALDAIARAAKRKEQKEQGAFDGRFRPRVVKSKKTYTRKPKKQDPDLEH